MRLIKHVFNKIVLYFKKKKLLKKVDKKAKDFWKYDKKLLGWWKLCYYPETFVYIDHFETDRIYVEFVERSMSNLSAYSQKGIITKIIGEEKEFRALGAYVLLASMCDKKKILDIACRRPSKNELRILNID
jgi:hypothetical protein